MSRAWFSLFLMLLLACGGDKTGPARIEAEGSWSGSFTVAEPITLSLTLVETTGNVTGNGTLVSPSASVALSVAGTYVPPALSVSVTAPGFNDLNLSATVGETSMTGTLNGSGFSNQAVTLTRQ